MRRLEKTLLMMVLGLAQSACSGDEMDDAGGASATSSTSSSSSSSSSSSTSSTSSSTAASSTSASTGAGGSGTGGETSGMGGAAAGGAGTGGAGVKRVFVTEATFTGDLRSEGAGADGLEGGDKLCAQAAAGANLGGSWRAWLSSKDIPAIDRVNEVGPWYLVDEQTLVFDGKTALADPPKVPISMTEKQGSGLGAVWTGTADNGKKTGAECESWTDATLTGTVGRSDGKSNWTEETIAAPCSLLARLYCFEQ